MSYYGQGLYAQAIPHLTFASKQDPNNQRLHYVLAESCVRTSQTGCALSESQRVLELDPESPEAHMLLGEARDGIDQFKEGIAEFAAAEQRDPSTPNVHSAIGYLYWKLHDYDQALPEFEEDTKRSPESALSYAYMGDMAYRNNQDDVAAALLEKAIAVRSSIRLAHFDLGCVPARQGDASRAILEFREAKRLDPSQQMLTTDWGVSTWPLGKIRRHERNSRLLKCSMKSQTKPSSRKYLVLHSLRSPSRRINLWHDIFGLKDTEPL